MDTKIHSFFKESEFDKNVLFYHYNTGLVHKLEMFLIPSIFQIPFLFIAFRLTSISKNYVLESITIQNLIFIPFCFITTYFLLISLTYTDRKLVKESSTVLPVFKSSRLNILISIVLLLIYIYLVRYFWIPDLTEAQKNSLEYISLQHLFLFMDMLFIVFIFSFSLALVKAVTKGTINVTEGYFLLEGKTLFRKKFKITFHFSEKISIVVQPFLYLNPKSEKPINVDKKKFGVFLQKNSEIFKIYDAMKEEIALTYAEQISKNTKWQLFQKNEPFSFKNDELTFSIAR